MMNAQEHFNAAHGWLTEGDRARAVGHLRAGLLDDPDNGSAWHALGTAYYELDDPFLALMCFDRALASVPNSVDLHVNRAAALLGLGKIGSALAVVETALSIDAIHPYALANKAQILAMSNRRREAADWFHQAMQVAPTHVYHELSLMRGFALLGSGQLKAGWKACYPRWFNPSVNRFRKRPLSAWDGRAPGDILLVTDQGFGDTIQLMRYAPALKQRIFGRVYVEAQKQIARLVSQMPGVDGVFVLGEEEPPAHIGTYCAMASLPHFLHTDTIDDIPWPGPYIDGNGLRAAIWRQQLAPHCKDDPLKVGICWATGERIDAQARQSMRRKTIELTEFGPLAKVPGVTFVSLQVGDCGGDARNPPSGMRLIDLHHDITDFQDTAALIENLDLVVSVCTSVAHLAGAMGKPTWLLLHACGDWRWLENRTDTPWYPSMRIFQQPQWGDWRSVMIAVAESLHRRIDLPQAA